TTPSSRLFRTHCALHSLPTRRSSDLPHAPSGDRALAPHKNPLSRSPRFKVALMHRAGTFAFVALLVPAFVLAACEKQPSKLEQRSEEHTSELQSRENLVCRLLLEKKN